MPEDERPPPAADLSGPAWLELLGEGELEVLGRLPWSSNYSFLATVRSHGVERRAVYKPGRGERPLWDYPGGLFRREVAAYELSAALSLGIVPETVLREEAPHGEGSVQRFVDADFSEHYFTLLNEPLHHPQLRRIAAFDLLLNNGDRKGGHLIIDSTGRSGDRPRPLLPRGGQAPDRHVGLRRRGVAGRGARGLRARRRRGPGPVAALAGSSGMFGVAAPGSCTAPKARGFLPPAMTIGPIHGLSCESSTLDRTTTD